MSDAFLALARRGRTPMIHQDEAAECGLACLAMIAGHHGHDVDLLALRARFGVSIKGMTLTTLLTIAGQLKLDARPIRCDLDDLSDMQLPAILHWGFTHFTVLTKISGRKGNRSFIVNDPAHGERVLTVADVSAEFTGIVVEVVPAIAFKPKRERSKLSLWQLWSKAPGLGGALGRIMILSLLIELFSLAAPFYLQIGLDSVVPSHDLNLLSALALGFGALAILSQVTSFVRSWAIISLSNELGFRLVSNLFRHMVSLPISWFQKRSVGDVLTRFNASQPITDLLGNGLVQVVIDGVMAVVTLALMLTYSPLLTSVTICGLIIYIAIRWSYFGVLRMRNISIIQAQGREQSTLIETIRGMMPIRLFGREQDRLRLWQSRRASVVNTGIKIARLQAVFSSLNTTIITLENIVLIYLAIRLNVSGGFTVGMITAFSAYKQQFLTSSLGLVGKIADYRMLDVQLGRMGDIVLSEPEPSTSAAPLMHKIESVELQGISFAYGPGDADVLSNINIVISAGERVAITGSSGGGKTTLLKILLGLLDPTDGIFLVNGKLLSKYNLAAYRSKVGCVMQDDALFTGTIAENIAFFDPMIDQDRVEIAAKSAIIHDDIMKMPMSYQSFVGDMGSALSGGQKQRVLLARALYRNPEILVLDEATSHLDSVNEELVNNALRQNGTTCIIVAHRQSTIATADRVLSLRSGSLESVNKFEKEMSIV